MNETIIQQFFAISKVYSQYTAQLYKKNDKFNARSYQELYDDVMAFAAALLYYKVEPQEPIGLFANNRVEWLVANLGILASACYDVPRSGELIKADVVYIIEHSQQKYLVIESYEKLWKYIAEYRHLCQQIQFIVCMEAPFGMHEEAGVILYHYDYFMEQGRNHLKICQDELLVRIQEIRGADRASILYTSGTTGEPKGVILSHKNFMVQVHGVTEKIDAQAGDVWLSILPVGHAFARAMQFIAIGNGCALAYSKPIGSVLLSDIQQVHPMWIPSVPRLWSGVLNGIVRKIKEQSAVKYKLFMFFLAIGIRYKNAQYAYNDWYPHFKTPKNEHNHIIVWLQMMFYKPLYLLGDLLIFRKMRALFGTAFKGGISGGAALPRHVAEFFRVIGVLILEGYGLTETAPVISVMSQACPYIDTIGMPLLETSVRIINSHGGECEIGEIGEIEVYGPQVMEGYYRDKEQTREIFHGEWLKTGDLGRIGYRNEIQIVGRSKDTIVLLNGKNVEPVPIENALCSLPLISFVMVVGNEQKQLGALIVPDFEYLCIEAQKLGIMSTDMNILIQDSKIIQLYRTAISSIITVKNGFLSTHRIGSFVLLEKPFAIGEELSLKQDLKRNFIYKKYHNSIKKLYT